MTRLINKHERTYFHDYIKEKIKADNIKRKGSEIPTDACSKIEYEALEELAHNTQVWLRMLQKDTAVR